MNIFWLAIITFCAFACVCQAPRGRRNRRSGSGSKSADGRSGSGSKSADGRSGSGSKSADGRGGSGRKSADGRGGSGPKSADRHGRPRRRSADGTGKTRSIAAGASGSDDGPKKAERTSRPEYKTPEHMGLYRRRSRSRQRKNDDPPSGKVVPDEYEGVHVKDVVADDPRVAPDDGSWRQALLDNVGKRAQPLIDWYKSPDRDRYLQDDQLVKEIMPPIFAAAFDYAFDALFLSGIFQSISGPFKDNKRLNDYQKLMLDKMVELRLNLNRVFFMFITVNRHALLEIPENVDALREVFETALLGFGDANQYHHLKYSDGFKIDNKLLVIKALNEETNEFEYFTIILLKVQDEQELDYRTFAKAASIYSDSLPDPVKKIQDFYGSESFNTVYLNKEGDSKVFPPINPPILPLSWCIRNYPLVKSYNADKYLASDSYREVFLNFFKVAAEKGEATLYDQEMKFPIFNVKLSYGAETNKKTPIGTPVHVTDEKKMKSEPQLPDGFNLFPKLTPPIATSSYPTPEDYYVEVRRQATRAIKFAAHTMNYEYFFCLPIAYVLDVKKKMLQGQENFDQQNPQAFKYKDNYFFRYNRHLFVLLPRKSVEKRFIEAGFEAQKVPSPFIEPLVIDGEEKVFVGLPSARVVGLSESTKGSGALIRVENWKPNLDYTNVQYNYKLPPALAEKLGQTAQVA